MECGAARASRASGISKRMLILYWYMWGELTADRAFRQNLQQPLLHHPPSLVCKHFSPCVCVCAQGWFMVHRSVLGSAVGITAECRSRGSGISLPLPERERRLLAPWESAVSSPPVAGLMLHLNDPAPLPQYRRQRIIPVTVFNRSSEIWSPYMPVERCN